MKIQIAAAVAGAVVLTLAGCSSTSATNEGDAPGAAQNTSGASKPASNTKPIKFGDTVRIKSDDGSARYTVTKPKHKKPGALGVASGKKLQAVRVTIVGLSGKIDVNPLYFKAQDAQGDSFDVGVGDLDGGGLDAGTVGPGDRTRGFVAFEVPKHKTIATVTTTGPLFDSQATWRR